MAEGILKYRGAVSNSRCGSIARSNYAQVSSYVAPPSLLSLSQLADNPRFANERPSYSTMAVPSSKYLNGEEEQSAGYQ
jgi:hypothetical protein